MLLLLSFFLGFFITFSSGCQAPGNECWSFANGAASGGCCTGTQCGPWSPDGSAWDGSSPWYCLSAPKIAAGGTCNYDAKIGLCADGLYCCSGVCSSACSAPATTTTTTTTTTSTTTTTTEQCTAQGREACYSQGTPGYDAAKLCCEPYTCETIQPGVGKCTGTNLPEGSECWSETYSKGECASGLSCINNVCTVFTDNPACLESGITGSNLCFPGALNEKVNKPCCNPAPSGSTNVWCLSSTDTSVTDKFCMEYNIEENQACGTTEAFGYIGYCKGSLECQNGVCTGTTSTTTTSTTTTTTTTLPCIESTKKCWDGANGGLVGQGRCCSGSDCDVSGLPFNDYFCP